MKTFNNTLTALTGVNNKFVNSLIFITLLSIAFLLGAVVVSAFSDLTLLNRAF